MITYSHALYDWLEPALGIFERHDARFAREDAPHGARPHDVILFGLGRYGLGIAGALRAAGLRVLGVDFSPEAIRHARIEGYDVLFGDATDPEFLAHLPLSHATWLVLAVPDHDTGLTHDDPRKALVRNARDLGYQGRVAVTAQGAASAAALTSVDVDLVMMPYRDAALAAARMILDGRPTSRPAPVDPLGQQELLA